jgi:hypothetical protein
MILMEDVLVVLVGADLDGDYLLASDLVARLEGLIALYGDGNVAVAVRGLEVLELE